MVEFSPNGTEETPGFSSLDVLKTEFQMKLDGILYKRLTVENIETFADEALAETVGLVDEVLYQYKNNPNLDRNADLEGKAEEDDAFNKLNLPDLQAVLDSVVEVKDKIDNLKKYINDSKTSVDKVITPPQPTEGIKLPLNTDEQNQFSDRRFFPRLLTLMYLLEQDFEIPKEDVAVTEGLVRPDMVRKTPYVRADIPDLGRLVYICDEEGNVTYVFDKEVMAAAGVSAETLDLEDKGDKNALIKTHPGIGVRIKQTPNWNRNMVRVLSQPIRKPEEDLETADDKEGSEVPKSEFKKERNSLLPFADFQSEVGSLYLGEGDIAAWYREERIRHFDWPFHPDLKYKNTGWIGWPELVGRERKSFLSFDVFSDEVKGSYFGTGNVEDWYNMECKKHTDWPKNLRVYYRNDGWVGWPELVGKENRLKRNLLPFQDFRDQVRALYPGGEGIIEWFNKEKKNHSNWPSNPALKYKDYGWTGYRELVS